MNSISRLEGAALGQSDLESASANRGTATARGIGSIVATEGPDQDHQQQQPSGPECHLGLVRHFATNPSSFTKRSPNCF